MSAMDWYSAAGHATTVILTVPEAPFFLVFLRQKTLPWL
jgi:hypothetical protein